MEIKLNILSVIMILGFVQGVFLSFFVLNSKKYKRESKLLLFGLLFTASLLFLLGALYISRYTELLIIFGPFLMPAFTLLGPILYLYISSMLDFRFKIKPIHALYSLPYFTVFFYLTSLYFLPENEQIVFIQKFYLGTTGTFESIFRYFDAFYRLIFLLLSIQVLKNYRKDLKNEFSSTEKIDFGWLKYLLIIYLITIIITFIITVFGLSNDFRVILAIVLAILMYVIGYKFMRGSQDEIKTAEIIVPKKYEKSGLTDEKKTEIKSQLLNLMKVEKLYLEPEVSARFLAEKLNISINHLSQVMNEKFDKNFFEFINSYRIEDAKRLLISKNELNHNILSIAFEVGFQSKSTFNSVFKKQTGKTPTQFKKTNTK